MGNRRFATTRIKSVRTYNTREAAKAIGATKATIRYWAKKNGLPAIEGVFPAIYRGVDLKAFLTMRSAARKQPCGPGRLFCLRCKEPKIPAYNEVEFYADGPTLGRLVGLCPTCLTIMVRRTSRARLADATANLSVKFKPADSHLGDTAEPRCNSHIEEA